MRKGDFVQGCVLFLCRGAVLGAVQLRVCVLQGAGDPGDAPARAEHVLAARLAPAQLHAQVSLALPGARRCQDS